MNKIETWIVAGVFTALISIPVVVFAAGARPEPNQNRPPTPLPDINVSGILDRELTPQLDAYLEDSLIIAPGAVAAEAWTDVALGDNPSPDVTLGSSGWLYYTFSLDRPCLTDADLDRFVDAVTRAERVVAASGRNLLIAIAPDKATIVPDFLPDVDTCVSAVADAIGSLDGPSSLVVAWDEMRTARSNERPIYFRLDTHWTNEGAAVMAEAIVNRLQPDAWRDDAVREIATVDHEGDLTVLLGLPATEETIELETSLPGAKLVREERRLLTATGNEYDQVVSVDFTSSDAPFAGPTLVMHDSYGWALTPMLAPYFSQAAFIAESDPSGGHMQDDLEAATTVVFQIVQRSLHELLLDSDLAAGFMAAYGDTFPATAEGTKETGERLELEPVDQDVYVIVEMAPGSDAAEVAYNDVTAKLNPDSPRSAYYVGSGGTMYFAGEVDYRIVSIER